MNVVLVVVDSLRARSLRYAARAEGFARTPFFDALASRSVHFTAAHATECWTLPSHLSMFTGLMPSEHGAHFQSMRYDGQASTIAEILRDRGYFTECITRNSVFDGTIAGVLRGFESLRIPLQPIALAALPTLIFSALSKRRVQRIVEEAGFFGALQKSNRDFVGQLTRMGMPSDNVALAWALARMADCAEKQKPLFLFVNLYDVHSPYCPNESGLIPALTSLDSVREALALPRVLPLISRHAYLEEGFRLSEWSRAMLLRRYHAAIELEDRKLHRFYEAALQAGLLDNTLLVITSDHGEAFGEHGLYLHDASVFETHLHVPLLIHHPDLAPQVVDDVVSTRDLFGLMVAAGDDGDWAGTLLDPASVARRGIARAEHFHHPRLDRCRPIYRCNQEAIVVGRRKLIGRAGTCEEFDLVADSAELTGRVVAASELADALGDDRHREPIEARLPATQLAKGYRS